MISTEVVRIRVGHSGDCIRELSHVVTSMLDHYVRELSRFLRRWWVLQGHSKLEVSSRQSAADCIILDTEGGVDCLALVDAFDLVDITFSATRLIGSAGNLDIIRQGDLNDVVIKNRDVTLEAELVVIFDTTSTVGGCDIEGANVPTFFHSDGGELTGVDLVHGGRVVEGVNLESASSFCGPWVAETLNCECHRFCCPYTRRCLEVDLVIGGVYGAFVLEIFIARALNSCHIRDDTHLRRNGQPNDSIFGDGVLTAELNGVYCLTIVSDTVVELN